MTRNVCIVHFNTPELTEALVKSIRKHGGEDYKIYIFDNSDQRPFKKKLKGVKVFNNTKGQYLDFDAELAKYPEKDVLLGCSKGCIFGSDKHIMSVQKLWDLVPEGFMLMDSDILLKANVDFMFMDNECSVGHVCYCSGPRRQLRLAPMLLYINVPMCVAGGAKFFDPDRSWALHDGTHNMKNGWDAGASFFDDVKRLKPQCHGKNVDIHPLIVHLGSGSWAKGDLDKQMGWLEKHKDLWQ